MRIKTTEQIAKRFNPDFDNKEKWVALDDILLFFYKERNKKHNVANPTTKNDVLLSLIKFLKQLEGEK